jgi:hypothetical protein
MTFASTGYRPLRVLVTVKTYPNPSTKYIETVCTAGITEEGCMIRMYPISFRLLEDEHRFSRYRWIRVRGRKAAMDARPESFNVDEMSIEPDVFVGPERAWQERKRLVLPHVAPSVEALEDDQQAAGRSLGLVRPAKILDFYRRPCAADWTAEQRQKLFGRRDMFRSPPPMALEKIPWDFVYHFTCEDPRCRGHRKAVLDWEVAQSYRKWRARYGEEGWWEKLRQKYWDELVGRRDLHFFMGTLARFKTWTIIGLFYPPKEPVALQVDRSGRRQGRQRLGDDRPMAQLRLPLEA